MRLSKVGYPLSMLAALLTILLNIIWTLVSGSSRDFVTIAGVLMFALASTLHAYTRFGSQFAIRLLATVLPLTLAIEILGVSTGFPFGEYKYDLLRLGPTAAGVPFLIPFAWMMMIYPASLVAREFKQRPLLTVFIGGLLMATWDLFLDPQMVNEGYWTWFSAGSPVSEIPISNFLGWFTAASFVLWLTSKTIPENLWLSKQPSSYVAQAPYVSIMWVWLGSFLANIVPISPFLAQPLVAIQGFVGMGFVLIPWSRQRWSAR
jgi:putative membrane protein